MKHLPVILLLLKFSFVYSQDKLNLTGYDLPNTRREEGNPQLLASKLIEGKNTEKEKFDAIFVWVAKNIHYNHGAYMSPKGHTLQSTKFTLKHKLGVCIDYAKLMDTLCFFAGITNVTVLGYTKDFYFDVNDSLYIDNHAWNAVKLDNRWYLYDVTWSGGTYELKVGKWGERIIKWRKKLAGKIKQKTIHIKYKGLKGCPNTERSAYKKVYSTTFWLRLKIKIANRLKVRFKPTLIKEPYPPFYLSNPEVFSSLHIPTIPYWSLVEDANHIRTFEIDSGFYFQNPDLYQNQKREGRVCVECDHYVAMEAKERLIGARRRSFSFNPRNFLFPSQCNLEIARIHTLNALSAKDSLIKVSELDSSIQYLETAKENLHIAKTKIKEETTLLKKKNNRKKLIHFNENREYIKQMNLAILTTLGQKRNMGKLDLGIRSGYRKIETDKKNIRRMYRSIDFGKKKISDEKKAEKAELKMQKCMNHCDSLTSKIEEQKIHFNRLTLRLEEALWSRLHFQDSINYQFFFSGLLRYYSLSDNYKKPTVDIRNTINRQFRQYQLGLKENVFLIADSCTQAGLLLLKLIDGRNKKIIESMVLLKSMVELDRIKESEAKTFFVDAERKLNDTGCEILESYLNITSAAIGFHYLKYLEKEILHNIYMENGAENYRFREVEKKIYWRFKKYNSVPQHNLVYASNQLKMIKKYKKEYLKSFKKKKK